MEGFTQKSVENFFKAIEESDKICLTGHKAPDGDCISSIFAIHRYIKSEFPEKKLTIILEGKIPYNYSTFVDYSVIEEETDENFDLLLIFDCANVDRMGKSRSLISKCKCSISVDHHETNSMFAELNYFDKNATATGEILYRMLKKAGKNISKPIAEYLYISILTDTDKFTAQCTTSDSFRMAAELTDSGINISEISTQVYHSKPAGLVKAYVESASTINLYYDNHLAIASITRKMTEKNSGEINEVDGVIDLLKDIREVEIACVIKELESKVMSVSIHSKGKKNAAEIASQFGGGGHAESGGFNLNTNIDLAQNIIVDYFQNKLIN